MSDVPPKEDAAAPSTEALVAALVRRGLTVAIAESLTGGLVAAELVRPPGASSVVVGGIIAYATEVKRDLLGVDADLLEREGPVHPEVARQMASGVRRMFALDSEDADIGLSTTGVAGPDPQEDHEPGTVFVGIAWGDRVEARRLDLDGSRDRIRARTVTELLAWLGDMIAETDLGGE